MDESRSGGGIETRAPIDLNDSDPNDAGGTARMLALSDGVFAFAITLLVLDIKVPQAETAVPAIQAVWAALRAQWPVYFAFAFGFTNIAVMWANHVTLFRSIKRTDHNLAMLNGLLLLFITLNPFITSLLSSYLLRSPAHRQVAVIVYTGTWLTTALAFNAIWAYASAGRRLTDRRLALSHYRSVSIRYWLGLSAYLMAFLLAVFGLPTVSLALSVCLTLLFALPYNFSRAAEEAGTLEDEAAHWIFRRGMSKKG